MQKENKGSIDLTRGSIPCGILAFAIPLFLGQLLQQLYNMVDAWVIGNFADNDAFAAVSSTGTIVFLIIGFFSGIATGGTVVIDHGCGVKSYLFGLKTVTAQRGQTIEAGSPVGTAGTDHDLIFELRIGSKSVDPEPAMAGRSGLQYRESE